MKSTMRFHLSDLLQKQPPELFCKKGVLRNFAKFAGNTCVRVSVLKLQVGLKLIVLSPGHRT